MELRGSKMSYRAIANYLNEKSIPSKLGQKWNKTTVGEIIKRHQKKENQHACNNRNISGNYFFSGRWGKWI